jgi:polar amino acid transport system permease protein
MNLSATILPELVSSAPEILRGLWSTMGLATAITLIGVVGGILVFYLTLSPVPLVRRLVQGYISLLIGTPLLIILFLIYYGLPPLGIRLSPLVVALIGFGFNVSAYNARFLTTAYNALDPSEREAAAAQGFPPAQVFRLITLAFGWCRTFPDR